MNDKIAKATMSEVHASLQTAKQALDTRDTTAATAAIDRAITATSSVVGEKPSSSSQTRRPRTQKPRQRKQGNNGNGRGRVPIAQRREHVMTALRESGRPMSTAEIAEAIKTTPSNARTVVGKMDDELLEVVKAHGTEPARYDLRERVGAQT